MLTFAHNYMPDHVTTVHYVSNIEHSGGPRISHDVNVKTKELTAKQILSVSCATCGAGCGEGCELHTGALRTEPHRDRKLAAADVVESAAGDHAATGSGRKKTVLLSSPF